MCRIRLYHHKLPDSHQELAPLVTEVERFAMTDYAQALEAGSALALEQRKAIVLKLHQYTGLPVEYIEKADLRIILRDNPYISGYLGSQTLIVTGVPWPSF